MIASLISYPRKFWRFRWTNIPSKWLECLFWNGIKILSTISLCSNFLCLAYDLSKSKRKIEAFLIISPCEKEEEKNWTHLHGNNNNPNTLLKRTKRLSGLERSGVTFRSLYKHAKIISNGRCINRFLRETITTPCNPRATAAFVITLWLLIIMHRQPLHSSWPRCVHLHGVKRVATTFTFFFFLFFFFFAFAPHRAVWFSMLFSFSFFFLFLLLSSIDCDLVTRTTRSRDKDSSRFVECH